MGNQFKNLLTPDSHQDNISTSHYLTSFFENIHIMAGIFGTEQREKLEKTILSYPSIDNALSFLEKKTQVKKVYILYAVLACVVSWLMFGWGAQLLCNVILLVDKVCFPDLVHVSI